jgi:glycosyltransferase involved in cell wall biosynthesis
MKISIIIPAYNEAENILNTINSCKNQTYDTYEILVVVNGSTDNTFEVAKQTGVRVFSLREGNFAKARNFGVKKTRGEVIVFLDADSILPNNFLTEIELLIKRGFSIGKAKIHPNNKKILAKFVCFALNLTKFRAWGNCFVDKKLYETLNGCNPKTKFPDEDLAVRANQKVEITKTKSYVITDMRSFEKKGYLKNLYLWISKNPQGAIE